MRLGVQYQATVRWANQKPMVRKIIAGRFRQEEQVPLPCWLRPVSSDFGVCALHVTADGGQTFEVLSLEVQHANCLFKLAEGSSVAQVPA